ncbi:pantoate--beta-alanine ligase [Pseudomonadales bacterium]|nr:pantoate--beta-alanine ligase [Pseudomonadales bacterium]
MQTLNQVKYLRAALNADKNRGSKIVLVPTMGNLHEGHLQLVRRAREVADIVVVSIFVNPMQFGATEDLDSYPRTLTEDQDKLDAENVDYLFIPNVEEMYPNGIDNHTTVANANLSNMLCGIHRPGHFQGVCTVVNKLLNLVQPSVAVFGEKDFQQLAIIKRMVSDLCMPIDIIGVPTARAHDGLALSSRNQYLSNIDRVKAPLIYETLQKTRDAIIAGSRQYETLCETAKINLKDAGFDVDYFDIRDQNNLSLLNNNADNKKIVILTAASLGSTRLLDNIRIEI